MKKILSILLVSMVCQDVGESIKRCKSEEAICYVYDTGWAGMMKSGRGAGISCNFKEALK